MKIIAKPKHETQILASVNKNAKADNIHKGIIERAEYCVNHLCGCKG